VVLYTADAANSAKTSAAILENHKNKLYVIMSDGHIFSDVADAPLLQYSPYRGQTFLDRCNCKIIF